MLKSIPERITYAQEKLIKMIEKSELRKWCLENGLSHSGFYRIAMGEQLPTYRVVSSVCHLIAPIDWLFYTDEPLPYPPQCVPQWNCKNLSKYVKEHRADYKVIAERYGLAELSAYNIFVAYRTTPSLPFIRQACDQTDPIDFFSDIQIPTLEQGDIISVSGTLLLVLSKKEHMEKTDTFIACPVAENVIDGLPLTDIMTKETVNTAKLSTYSLSDPLQLPKKIERLPDEQLVKVISVVKQNF